MNLIRLCRQVLTLTLLLISTSSLTHAGSHLNFQGTCSGRLKNGAITKFKYYSDYDGCKAVSTAAIVFLSGYADESTLIGTRSFTETRDIYSFPIALEEGETIEPVHLELKNSTGNTFADLTYLNDQNAFETVTVTCAVRDYHYEECQ